MKRKPPARRRSLFLVLVLVCVGAASVVVGAASLAGPASATALVAKAEAAVIGPAAPLPSDAACAAAVRSVPENKSVSRPANQTPGRQKDLPGVYLSRVTGNYIGSTDEILQWAACKWGISPDVVRSIAANESWWRATTLGDFTTDVASCAPGHPVGVHGRPGKCPRSVGLLQVNYRHHQVAFPEAQNSSAYNVDYSLAIWRSCYEGEETWLHSTAKAAPYVAGDGWGCIGRWYAGAWYNDEANWYIDHVRNVLAARTWERSWFQER